MKTAVKKPEKIVVGVDEHTHGSLTSAEKRASVRAVVGLARLAQADQPDNARFQSIEVVAQKYPDTESMQAVNGRRRVRASAKAVR